MNDKNKSLLIQAIIYVVSLIVTLTLFGYFRTKGFIKLSHYSSFLLLAPLGLYIIFGKHVYFRGEFLTMLQKIVWGLFFILVMPALFLFCGYWSKR